MSAGRRRLGRIAAIVAGLMVAALATSAAPAGAALHAAKLGTFDTPVYPVQAPGELGRLFVVEQGGRIELIDHGTKLAKPFLDISGRVLAPNDPNGGGEQGLLSVAFPSNYQTTRRFYVYYTNNDSSIEVDEFKRLAGNRDRADPNSRRQVIVIPHPTFTNHNGGTIKFGPDGHLYMATGDGGGVAKLHGRNARDLQSLLGKVLRIDPLPRAGKPYTVPRDNPYVGRPGRDEIYAYGLRNPFRFSFDRGRIAIGDVGQNSWEEVDILPTGDVNGVNFGWPAWEGNHPYTGAPGPDPPTFPIFEYPHHPACAVIGGVVVRDPALPSLDGRYLYGDRCVPGLRSFIPVVSSQNAVGDAPIGVSAPELTGINAGLNGHVYFTAGDGAYRLTESP